MNIRKFLGLAVIVLAGVCGVATLAWSEDKAAAPAVPGIDESMMKAFAEASTPGPHHKMLESMVGKFTYTNKMRMDPAGEWMSATGTCEGTMLLGGRYLQSVNRGEMMGSEFEGIGCLGYDNTTQKHVATWMDNMGTGIMFTEGTCSDDCKTMTFAGEMVDPMTRKMTKYKYVYAIKNKDSFNMKMWCANPADGALYECMNIDYARAK